jgi:septal ring factor EnvC (AmiA/AmiB activator)
VDNLWNNLVKGLQEGALAAADKAGDLTRVARARLDIAATKNSRHRVRAELGALVHELLEADADIASHDQLRALSGQLKELGAELAEREAAYEELQSELQASAAPEEDEPEAI